jgi:hypothetical protein
MARARDLGFYFIPDQLPQPGKGGRTPTTMELLRKFAAKDLAVLKGMRLQRGGGDRISANRSPLNRRSAPSLGSVNQFAQNHVFLLVLSDRFVQDRPA